MGIFDVLDVAGAEIIPTGNQPGGPFRAVIEKDEIMRGSKNDPNFLALVITYRISGQPYPQAEYLTLPQINGQMASPAAFPSEPKDDKGYSPQDYAKRSLSRLKTRLLSLGVPEQNMNNLREGDLAGINCLVTLVKDRRNPEFVRVGEVSVAPDVTLPGSTPQANVAPAASAPQVNMPNMPPALPNPPVANPFG